jgi:hypothetical protein
MDQPSNAEAANERVHGTDEINRFRPPRPLNILLLLKLLRQL